jgi:hypothetical protein
MFFSLCFEGKTGTDGNGRSKCSKVKGEQQTPFVLAKQQKRFAKILNDKEMIKIEKKRTGFPYLGIVLVSIVALGLFVQSCSNDSDMNEIDRQEFETYLSLGKPDFDFARDWNSLSETDKNTFKEAKKRMNITFEKNGICRTEWISGDQINISDELFDCFMNMIVISNKATEELNMFKPLWKPVRLKLKSEPSRTDNCVVQSLYYVLQSFGIHYSLSSIDDWIFANNYYEYTSTYGWAALYAPVLSHYLEPGGAAVNRTQGDYASALTRMNESENNKCIIVLSGETAHTVVAESYEHPFITYYDPQNDCYGQCVLDDDIIYMYEAMPF